MPEFVRDPGDWLRRLSPREWIVAAQTELRSARLAHQRGSERAALTGSKRAAGMALNAALIVEPNPRWGRTYVEHVAALAHDASVPEAVRGAGQAVIAAREASPHLFDRVHDIMAHAWFVVFRHELARAPEPGRVPLRQLRVIQGS